MNWVKAVVLALITVLAGYVFQRHMVFEDDPLRSLGNKDSVGQSLFQKYHVSSPFQSKLFFERGQATDGEIDDFLSQIQLAGYSPSSLVGTKGEWSDLVLLAPAMMDSEALRGVMSPEMVASRVEETKKIVWLPSGASYLALMDQDPLGLSRAMAEAGIRNLGLSPTGMGGGTVLVFDSPNPLSYDSVGSLWDAWQKISGKTHMIAGDFFALANFRAVRRDIMLTTLLSLPLNFLLFWFFVRRWEFLAFLVLGTVVSYAMGLVALGLFGGIIFTLVIAFTSTFVSFNNEYMVHLCGLDPEREQRSRLALGSAIGTTFIGFIVLLFAESVIVRQMAIVSIGAMTGFLAYLFVFREMLGGISLRPCEWKMFEVSPRTLGITTLVLLGCIAGLRLPSLHTRVESFGVSNALLDREGNYFGAKAARMGGDEVFAVEVGKDVIGIFERLKGRLGGSMQVHPLSMYREMNQQKSTIDGVLRTRYLQAVKETAQGMAREGIRISPAASKWPDFRAVQPEEFLVRISQFLPTPVWIEDGGRSWLVFGAKAGTIDVEVLSEDLARPIIALSPKLRHDLLLTGISRQLGGLFLAGLFVMAIYLYVIHRRWARLLYIGFPLIAGLALFLAVLRMIGPYELNVVHLMGFSLVIALAVDYSSIAVSTGFGVMERTKIFVTGLSTLASFGVLVLAKHPVLRDLGLVVSVGCGVALLFSLLIRIPDQEET